MKKTNKILMLIVFTTTLLFGGAIIQNFDVNSNGDNIILTWYSGTEQNVDEYIVLRGPDKDRLSPIATVAAKGDNSEYSFVDENAYKTTDSFYAYALVIVDRDGSRSEPMFKFVTHDGVSSVKRTWGSIKALFR